MQIQTVQYHEPKNPYYRDLELDPSKIIGVEALDEDPQNPMTSLIFDNGMTANVHEAADTLWQKIYEAKVAMMAAALKQAFGGSAESTLLSAEAEVGSAPGPEI